MRPPVSSGTVYIKDPVDVWNKEHAIGNAELAARLGSPSTFDRRGTVYAFDQFNDSPLKWETAFSGGAGHSITLSNEHPYQGEGCMKIVAPDTATEHSRAYRNIGGVGKNNVGMEANMTLWDAPNTIKPYTYMSTYTGTTHVQAGIKVDNGTLYYRNNTGGADPLLAAAWTSFYTSPTIYEYTAYPVKFVVDLETNEYIRCMFGTTEIDMSSYTPYNIATVHAPVVIAYMAAESNSGFNRTVYYDDFILTIEEPT